MPLPTLTGLRKLRADVLTMYSAADAEMAAIRAAHLGAVSRLTPIAMAANVGSAMLVLAAFSGEVPPGLWAWVLAVLVLSVLAWAKAWKRRGRVPERASVRAIDRATLHAAVLAGVWAVMPLCWFGSATPGQQLLIGTLTTGMLGAGTFMLSPLPRAAVAYAALFTASALGALWQAGTPLHGLVAMLLGFYSPTVVLGALAWWNQSTALARSQAEAVRQERMLALLLHDFEQHAGEALWELGLDGHLTHLSPRLGELIDASAADIAQLPLLALMERRSAEAARALQAAFSAGRPFRELQLSWPDADGRLRHLAMNGKPLLDDRGQPRGWRGVLGDVTDAVAGQLRLHELAHTDSLTGLANRFTLRLRLAEALQPTQAGALLMLDLDHFKGINDSLGHSAGDELLKVVAQRLRGALRPQDLVARLGGDEFAVLLAPQDAQQDPAALAQRLIDALGQPFEVQGRRVRVGASIGVAQWRGSETGVDELLVQADTALYAAKESGRARFEVYAPRLGERSLRRAVVEAGLRQAQAAGQLSLHWQPKVDVQRWQIVGAEALLRWQHPELGSVGPGEFIAVAEQSGLIDELGQWALRQACQAAAGPLQGLVISVNVSPIQLRDSQFVGQVRAALREFSLEPGRLELEITESVFIDDAPAALAVLHDLRQLGVRVALDDFGTGYSSLAYLRRFPFDTLKIDRAFVNEVLQQRDARAIVQMIAQLSATLGMRTVCEGVETPQQLSVIIDAGCHEVQGYLVSRPRPLADFSALWRAWRSNPPRLPLLH